MYSPYFFAMDINGTSSWGSDSDKASLDSELDAVYNKFISKGIAVVIGECGSINKSNESSRIALAEYFVKAAKTRKIPLIWWDNNYSVPNQGETFGIFNRNTLTWVFPSIVNALVKGTDDSVTPTPTPTPTPSTGAMALSTTVNSWNSGYIMNFTISNPSSSAINGWSLTVNKADFNISNIWNAQQTVSGDKIIITPMSYNSTISAGGTVSFSLQGSGTVVSNFSYTLN
jgi:endoglucanase